MLVSCDLMRSLQHLHEESVDGRVADQLEEEQVLQTLEADGAQGGQAQQQLRKPATQGNYRKILLVMLSFDEKNVRLIHGYVMN